jgi:hypothetical protein
MLKIWKQLSSTLAWLFNVVPNYNFLKKIIAESQWKFIYLFIRHLADELAHVVG